MSSRDRKVMGVLLGDITSGAVAEGERLPSLTDLAAQFGDHRHGPGPPARTARRRLVVVHHGRRANVGPEAKQDLRVGVAHAVTIATFCGPAGSTTACTTSGSSEDR